MLRCIIVVGCLICSLPLFSASHWPSVNEKFDVLNDSMELLQQKGRSSLPKMEKLLTEMRERAELDGAPDAEVLRTQFWRANLLIAKGETQEAKTILKEAISATDSVKMPYDYARLWQSYVSINNGYGQQIEDYMRVKDNVKVFSAYHDTLNLALSIFSLGHISLLAEDAEQALKYLQKSDSLLGILKMPGRQQVNRLLIADAMDMLDRKDDAYVLLNELLQSESCQKDTSFMVLVLFSAQGYARDAEEQSGLVRKAYELSQGQSDKYNFALASINLASDYLKHNLADSALFHMYGAIDYFKEIGASEMYSVGCKIMSDIYASKQMWDSAYYYTSQHISIDDSLKVIERYNQAKIAENRESIRHYEQTLQYEKSMKQMYVVISLLVLMAVVAIAAYLITFVQNKRKRAEMEQQLKTLENMELSMRLENEYLKNENYQHEIERKNREATSSALLITEKDRLLDELNKRINMEREAGNINPSTATVLRSQIRSQMSADDDWQFFKLRFEQVHSRFFVKLKERVPSLTEKEMHLCAYICIGMSNEQLARVLSVGGEAIKKARYRLRKKLPLQDNETIESFIRSIDAS